MITRGINVYRGLTKSKVVRFRHPINFKFSFNYGPRIDCTGPAAAGSAKVVFKDKNSGSEAYSGETNPGLFTTLFRKWYTPWIVEAYQDGEKIYEFDFEKSLYGSKVCISIDSSSLGDTLAWVPVAESFRQKYKCDLYLTSFWSELLCQFYPDIRFQVPGYREPGTHATFGLGWYEETDRNTHPRDPRTISLQQVAGDILGISLDGDVNFKNIPATISKSKPAIEGKYVCFAMDSTANAKHWHLLNGWQRLADELAKKGYKVAVIQKQQTNLQGVLDKTGDHDILERAIDVYHSSFVVGIGSGLSWLGWALGKPVVMISGFSDPKCEFATKNYRVINKNVCNGCFNDPSHKFDRGDWDWCPRLKETERRFECTKSISVEMVLEHIELLEKEQL